MAIFNIYRDRENSPKNAYFCKIINYTGVKVARKKKELPFLEKVTIKDVAAEGKAIAKIDDLVVFALAIWGFSKLEAHGGKYAQMSLLIGGILMLVLGSLLIINPSLLVL